MDRAVDGARARARRARRAGRRLAPAGSWPPPRVLTVLGAGWKRKGPGQPPPATAAAHRYQAFRQRGEDHIATPDAGLHWRARPTGGPLLVRFPGWHGHRRSRPRCATCCGDPETAAGRCSCWVCCWPSRSGRALRRRPVGRPWTRRAALLLWAGRRAGRRVGAARRPGVSVGLAPRWVLSLPAAGPGAARPATCNRVGLAARARAMGRCFALAATARAGRPAVSGCSAWPVTRRTLRAPGGGTATCSTCWPPRGPAMAARRGAGLTPCPVGLLPARGCAPAGGSARARSAALSPRRAGRRPRPRNALHLRERPRPGGAAVRRPGGAPPRRGTRHGARAPGGRWPAPGRDGAPTTWPGARTGRLAASPVRLRRVGRCGHAGPAGATLTSFFSGRRGAAAWDRPSTHQPERPTAGPYAWYRGWRRWPWSPCRPPFLLPPLTTPCQGTPTSRSARRTTRPRPARRRRPGGRPAPGRPPRPRGHPRRPGPSPTKPPAPGVSATVATSATSSGPWRRGPRVAGGPRPGWRSPPAQQAARTAGPGTWPAARPGHRPNRVRFTGPTPPFDSGRPPRRDQADQRHQHRQAGRHATAVPDQRQRRAEPRATLGPPFGPAQGGVSSKREQRGPGRRLSHAEPLRGPATRRPRTARPEHRAHVFPAEGTSAPRPAQ